MLRKFPSLLNGFVKKRCKILSNFRGKSRSGHESVKGLVNRVGWMDAFQEERKIKNCGARVLDGVSTWIRW